MKLDPNNLETTVMSSSSIPQPNNRRGESNNGRGDIDTTSNQQLPSPKLRRHIKRLSMNESFRRSKRSVYKFSLLEDTESLFSTDVRYYGGPYAHIRKTLDYKYHKHYTKERQWLQDSIIDKLLHEIVQQQDTSLYCSCMDNNKSGSKDFSRQSLGGESEHGSLSRSDSILSFADLSLREKMCSLPSKPWLVYIVGEEKVSKQDALKSLIEQDHFPILGFVLVDPEEIQTLLPEYSSYVQEYGKVRSIELMRKETGYIAEILTKAALKKGLNAIVFSTFWNADWYPSYFDLLRKDLHLLNIAILHVIGDGKEGENGPIISEAHRTSSLPTYLPTIDTTKSLKSTDFSVSKSNDSQRVICAVEKLKSTKLIDFNCTLRMSSNDDDNLYIADENKITWKDFRKQFEQKPVASGEGISQGIEEMIHRGESDFIRQFDIHKSTEENYKADNMNFYGAFAHIRATLVSF